jgi:isopenicillin-N N-acyltransferase-like protein
MEVMKKKVIKILLLILWFFEMGLAMLCLLLLFVLFKSYILPPAVPEVSIGKRTQLSENHFVLGNNYLKKNEFGIWEMYLEGEPYERGLIYGELAQELIQKQEDIFVGQINQLVPNRFWQNFLRMLIGYFNSEIPSYIPLENQQEIYGISQSFSDQYDYIAPKYMRILNYHAAHDIGHALNDYSMVGCTSFSLKGARTAGGEMLIGRNFDFYVGDEFAKEKLVLFVAPSEGYKFVSYSWAGFTGVASGLNEKGLSVTINASKSSLPVGSKMPISLLARRILQYASTIDQAVAIAKESETFVSETIMIGSASDGKTVLIEKSPDRMDVYDSFSDKLVCSNHYQSDLFKLDEINLNNIEKSDSKFRFQRVNTLIDLAGVVDVSKVIEFLRDQSDINGDTLGMGNPRAVNQLIAHHSVVIAPESREFYISTSDFQLGKFIGYDLSEIFKTKKIVVSDTILESKFIYSSNYAKFKEFSRIKKEITSYLLFDIQISLSEQDCNYFISQNSESYVTYELLGKYFMKKGDLAEASKFFAVALTKKVASINDENEIKSLQEKCRAN